MPRYRLLYIEDKLSSPELRARSGRDEGSPSTARERLPGFNRLEDTHTHGQSQSTQSQDGQLERQGPGGGRPCTWTPAALMWPWDPDHPGYRFPGHTASLRGVLSYPSTRIWPRQSPPIFKGNRSSVPLYPARPQPTSYSPKLGPYERPVSSLPDQSRHLLSHTHPLPTQPTNLISDPSRPEPVT